MLQNLKKGVWIAPWTGDPGRTTKIENAKEFNNRSTAWRAIERAQKIRPFENAQLTVRITWE